MKKTMLLLVAAVMAAPASAAAQVSEEEFNKLKERVKALEAENEKLVEQLSNVAAGAVKQGQAIKDVSDRVEKNELGLGALGDRVRDNEVKLEDLAKPDPSNPGKHVINLLGNMQRSANFRGDLHTATIGRLVITNDTQREQFLYVNGTLWRVILGKSYVTVPRGAVSVQRPGAAQEVLENWQYDQARGGFVLPYTYPPAAPTVPAATPVSGQHNHRIAGR